MQTHAEQCTELRRTIAELVNRVSELQGELIEARAEQERLRRICRDQSKTMGDQALRIANYEHQKMQLQGDIQYLRARIAMES